MATEHDTQSAAEVVRRLTDHEDLTDILLDIEDYLDSNDMYVYKNWKLGEVVAGPFTKPYWIKITLKYPYKQMPDPEGGLRLVQHGTKIRYRVAIEKVPVKVKSEADYQPGTKKPKLKNEKIWLIDLLIPRKFVQNIDAEIMDQYDDEVDSETLDSAAAENIDAEGAVKNDATPPPTV
jgi:hypothetical protein